ncbi:MAG: class I SAM-dependent methyltransferase [Bacillota bacterium]
MLLKNSLNISHEYVSKLVNTGDIVVDATMGNGNDTLLLARLVGENGKVYSFDIQQMALDATYRKLEAEGIKDRVQLILDGHQNIDKYVEPGVKAVMFNLGYLPKGDHSIGTKAETTIAAIEKCLKLIAVGGIIIIVVYYGGDSGFDEKNAVMEYIRTIDWRRYSVLVHDFVNQINCPPIAICIERYKE